MKVLSVAGSPLPALALRELTPEAKGLLDAQLLQYPSGYIASNFWAIAGVLRKLLDGVDATSTNAQEDSVLKQELLSLTELLMHKISTLHRALDETVTLLSKGSSSRAMRRLRLSLAAVVEKQFKIPVNLVKHDNHSLQWLEAVADSERISGFVVSGLIDQGLNGPANLGKKPKSVDEGYSYPRFLRDSLSSIYAMCEISEHALSSNSALTNVQKQTPSHTAQNRLYQVVEGLNKLSHRCFPSEHGAMVSEFDIEDDSLVEVRKRRLVQFKHCRFTYTLPHVEHGSSYKMPFWKP